MKTPKPDKSLTGNAGTYFAAAELSRRGYIALPTIKNTRGIDILASSLDGTAYLLPQPPSPGDGVTQPDNSYYLATYSLH